MYQFLAVSIVVFCGWYLIRFHPKEKTTQHEMDETEKFYH